MAAYNIKRLINYNLLLLNKRSPHPNPLLKERELKAPCNNIAQENKLYSTLYFKALSKGGELSEGKKPYSTLYFKALSKGVELSEGKKPYSTLYFKALSKGVELSEGKKPYSK